MYSFFLEHAYIKVHFYIRLVKIVDKISFMLIRFLISLPIRHELGIQVSTFVTFSYSNLNLVMKIVILNF